MHLKCREQGAQDERTMPAEVILQKPMTAPGPKEKLNCWPKGQKLSVIAITERLMAVKGGHDPNPG